MRKKAGAVSSWLGLLLAHLLGTRTQHDGLVVIFLALQQLIPRLLPLLGSRKPRHEHAQGGLSAPLAQRPVQVARRGGRRRRVRPILRGFRERHGRRWFPLLLLLLLLVVGQEEERRGPDAVPLSLARAPGEGGDHAQAVDVAQARPAVGQELGLDDVDAAGVLGAPPGALETGLDGVVADCVPAALFVAHLCFRFLE